jgi:hypothetical protein
MPIAERPSPSKASGAIESTVLTIVACGFLLFNLLVGVFVHRALPGNPSIQKEAILVSLGD